MLVVVITFTFAAEFIDHGDIVRYKRRREIMSGRWPWSHHVSHRTHLFGLKHF